MSEDHIRDTVTQVAIATGITVTEENGLPGGQYHPGYPLLAKGSPDANLQRSNRFAKLSKLQRAVLLYALENRGKFRKVWFARFKLGEAYPGTEIYGWHGSRLTEEEIARAYQGETKLAKAFLEPTEPYDLDTEWFKIEHFGWKPSQYCDWGSREYRSNPGVFSRHEIGRKKFNSTKAALSRCLSRLQKRGLLDRVKWYGWTLTDKGVEIASMLAEKRSSP